MVEACVRAGACALQIREKHLDDAALLEWCTEVRRVVHACNRPDGGRTALIINDRPEIALACGADGVHLGARDRDVAEVREEVGNRLLIGATCHSVDEARAAARAGADHLGVGPMFLTTTKDTGTPQGASLLADVLAAVDLPCFAIGGITARNVSSLVAAGATGVAVCQAVIGAVDPGTALRELDRALAGGQA